MSSLPTERALLIQEIGDRATRAVADTNPGVSCVRQRSFPMPLEVVRQVWPSRMNLSGRIEPGAVDPASLRVTEIDLASFLSTRERLPKITVVELELKAADTESSISPYWNYGVRLGYAGDPEHLLLGIGFKQPKPIGAFEMITRPVPDTESRHRISVSDLRAFRNFLQYVQNPETS